MKNSEKTKEQLSKEIDQLKIKITELEKAKANQKKAKEVLIFEKEFSHKIIKASSAIIVGLDKDHLIRIFNKGAEKITGYKKSEVIGKDWFDIFFPAENIDEMNKVWKDSWGITSYFHVNDILTKTGEKRIISWRTTGMYEEDDITKHLLLSIGEDITDRKQAEEKIKHLNLVLHAIRNVNQLIMTEKNRDMLIQKVCNILIEDRGYHNAWIVLLGKQKEYINSAESGLGKSFIPIRKMLEEGTLTNCGYATLKKKDLTVIKDPPKECLDCPLSASYSGHSSYSICIRHNDNIYGLLTVSASRHYVNSKEEQSLFKEVAGDIAFALYSIEMEEERKQAEEALKESENQLQTLIDNMPDFVCFKDGDGRWLLANKAGIRTFQLEGIDYLGKKDSELAELNKKLQGSFLTCKESDARVWKEDTLIHAEETVPDADGSVRVYDVIKVPVFQTGRERKGIIVIGHDITERKQAEYLLMKSEKKYRELFEKSEDAILIIHNWKFVDCNQATVNMLRYNNKSELLNTHPSELSPKKQPDGKSSFTKANEMIKIALKNGSHRFEWDHKRNDGEVFPVEVLLTAISIDEKNQILHTVWRDITERKQAEEALKENEERYRQIYKFSPDSIIIHDMDMNILDANNKAVEEFGYSKVELLKKTIFELHPENELKHSAQVLVDMNKEDMLNVETKFVRKDGSIFLADATPCKYTLGSKPVIHVVIRDITERKQAEEKLLFLSSITEQVTDSIVVTNLNYKITYINQATEKLFGYSPKELKGKTPEILNADPDVKQIQENIYNTVSSKKVWQGAHLNRKKDGSTFICEFKISPLKDEQGKISSYIAIQRDITERKQAEKKLKESEEKYRLIVENANDGIEITQEDRIIFANSQFAEMLGYKSGELKNILFSQIFTEQATHDLNDRSKRREAGMVVPYQYETTFKKKDGTIIDVDIKYEIIDYKQEPATFAIISDITDKKKAERKLAQYQDHLEELVKERTKELEEAQKQLIQKERLAVLGQLSGGVAHELRNPLGVISNSIYYLNMKLKDKDEKVKKHLALLKREIRRSDNMILKLLDFSKVKLLYITETNVNTLIKETIEETKIPEYIDLEMDLDEKIPQLQLDPDKMQRVFQNMISNAIQAMPEKGKLHIKTSSNDDFTEISFGDNGQGIVKENLKKIFEPLITTRAKGIGLGLAIVKNIIDYHKGKIDVKSEVGKGTTFTIKLRNYEVEKL